MVVIQKHASSTLQQALKVKVYYLIALPLCLACVLFGAIAWFAVVGGPPHRSTSSSSFVRRQEQHRGPPLAAEQEEEHRTSNNNNNACYRSLKDLTPAERFPAKGSRHMVQPPADDNNNDAGGVTLVCCDTTVGPWSVLVHRAWAPVGADRFLEMVRADYFSYQVPLFRCVKNWLCQFGLAGLISRDFARTLPDDPPWLPVDRGQNDAGVKRFAEGYLAYAGNGKNSRSNQFIVALHNDAGLGGPAPWEVPWGELVGQHSFDTLRKISTEYGDHGPKQQDLWRADALEKTKKDFPHLDFITSCRVVDEEEQRQPKK